MIHFYNVCTQFHSHVQNVGKLFKLNSFDRNDYLISDFYFFCYIFSIFTILCLFKSVKNLHWQMGEYELLHNSFQYILRSLQVANRGTAMTIFVNFHYRIHINNNKWFLVFFSFLELKKLSVNFHDFRLKRLHRLIILWPVFFADE